MTVITCSLQLRRRYIELLFGVKRPYVSFLQRIKHFFFLLFPHEIIFLLHDLSPYSFHFIFYSQVCWTFLVQNEAWWKIASQLSFIITKFLGWNIAKKYFQTLSARILFARFFSHLMKHTDKPTQNDLSSITQTSSLWTIDDTLWHIWHLHKMNLKKNCHFEQVEYFSALNTLRNDSPLEVLC